MKTKEIKEEIKTLKQLKGIGKREIVRIADTLGWRWDKNTGEYRYELWMEVLKEHFPNLDLYVEDEEDDLFYFIMNECDEYLDIGSFTDTIEIQKEIIVALRHALENTLDADEFEDYISYEVGVGDNDGTNYDKIKVKIVNQLIADYM